MDIGDTVAQVLVRVLMIDPERVVPDADLFADLGAESIDILDMLFGLEDALGVEVTPDHWTEWLASRFPEPSATKITVTLVESFSRERLSSAA